MPEFAIGLLLIAGGTIWRFAFSFQEVPLELGELIAYCGAAYLGIGLVRDLILKYSGKPSCEAPKRADLPTICFESFVGPIITAAGLALLVAGVQHPVRPSIPALVITLGVLFIVSGAAKDLVFKFAREKNHRSVIPW